MAQETRMMGLPGRERSLTIFSAVCVQYVKVLGQTDKRTDTGRHQRLRLLIASRRKNRVSMPRPDRVATMRVTSLCRVHRD